jgi:hypothetical protein
MVGASRLRIINAYIPLFSRCQLLQNELWDEHVKESGFSQSKPIVVIAMESEVRSLHIHYLTINTY